MRFIVALCLVVVGCSANDNSGSDAGGDAAVPTDGGSGADGPSSPPDLAPAIGASVLQLHNHANHDGVFTDPSFTKARLANLKRDAQFDGSYAQAGASGPAYAQPLFLDGNGAGDVVLVATEDNYVIAFDGTSGKLKWKTGPDVIGKAGAANNFSCGNVDPSGITGTPVIDPVGRSIYFQADTFDGSNVKHLIWALSVDDGTPRAGWPLDVGKLLPNFGSAQQGERGALIIVGNAVYVPFGGRAGDCTPYRGYVVGVPLNDPAHAFYFQTTAQDSSGGGLAAGIWSTMGITSDGTSLFFATGNTQPPFPTVWTSAYSEGVFRLGPTLAFDATDTSSYFVPYNWYDLDTGDTDISGSGVSLVDMPGTATPHLAVVLGKDKNAYVLDRDHLGGVQTMALPSTTNVASNEIINAPSAYTTQKGTYVTYKAACPSGGQPTINAIKIGAGPSASYAWCANVPGGGSPIVTSSGAGDTVVWFVSSEGEGITPDNKLHGFDGDSGMPVVASEAMGSSRRFNSPIAAKGRFYVATDSQLYSFVVP